MCVRCQWRLSEDYWGLKWINKAFSHCNVLMERSCCNVTLNLLLKDIKNKYLALSKQYNQTTFTLTPLLLTGVLWASSTIMSLYNPMYFILFIFTLCQIAIDKHTFVDTSVQFSGSTLFLWLWAHFPCSASGLQMLNYESRSQKR